jgi:hypothetical protein
MEAVINFKDHTEKAGAYLFGNLIGRQSRKPEPDDGSGDRRLRSRDRCLSEMKNATPRAMQCCQK